MTALFQMINKLLKYFNVVVSKRSTIDILHGKLNDEGQGEASKGVEDLEKNLLKHQIATHWKLIDHLEKKAVANNLVRDCPLCGASRKDDEFEKYDSYCIFSGGVLHRHQCPECDLIFGADKMLGLTDDELANDYEWHYKVYSETDCTEEEKRAFFTLNPKKEGVYLNFGSGAWSKSIPWLRKAGWQVYGFEPHCADLDSEDFIITSIEELKNMRFDGIFSNNVLEHLPQPAQDLNMMAKLLKKDGIMSHATPCFEYMYEYTRFHLFFFLGRSREVLAEKASLSIVEYNVDEEFMNIVLKVK